MENLRFNYQSSLPFITQQEIDYLSPYTKIASEALQSGSSPGSDFLGWVKMPFLYDTKEFDRVKIAADKIRNQSDILVVVGIGGSYLGAKAAIEFLSHSFYNNLDNEKRNGPAIVFAGINLSPDYLNDLLDLLEGKDFSINVISKSGTTTEPAISFRVLKELTESRYGKVGAKDRIFATTDRQKGALKQLADQEGYETFVVPDDIGGRFSVLTPVGLLPIAVSGANINALINGALDAANTCQKKFDENPALQYATIRNILNRRGKAIEMLVSYEPRCQYIAEWWKQLYGESEGKDGKGIFPASANFTADLHSLGQFLQDGTRNMFETILNITKPKRDFLLGEDVDNLDGLNYLSGKKLSYVNEKAMQGTLEAHLDGGVPNLIIDLEDASEHSLGNLFYFFEYACGVSGNLLGVNPFDQPGVEAYKKNMFRLLGKK
ncbi:MAG: glucose-6-phosphate isomerase [Saprospiraceae bacterium]